MICEAVSLGCIPLRSYKVLHVVKYSVNNIVCYVFTALHLRSKVQVKYGTELQHTQFKLYTCECMGTHMCMLFTACKTSKSGVHIYCYMQFLHTH